jgi:hypothetical protein
MLDLNIKEENGIMIVKPQTSQEQHVGAIYNPKILPFG